MVRAKRGEQVPPPPSSDEWGLRYGIKESLSFPELGGLPVVMAGSSGNELNV
jgi:hypothetical protein